MNRRDSIKGLFALPAIVTALTIVKQEAVIIEPLHTITALELKEVIENAVMYIYRTNTAYAARNFKELWSPKL